jgi:hypothetical protein
MGNKKMTMMVLAMTMVLIVARFLLPVVVGAGEISPRFKDNGDGTVTDNLTGLIWLKNANCFGERSWSIASDYCAGLGTGQCGLTDDSNAGDWRLPDIRELLTLVDYGNYEPALPSGHPFTGAKHNYYWSSKEYVGRPGYAWFVHMGHGYVGVVYKDHDYYLWPVRNHD